MKAKLLTMLLSIVFVAMLVGIVLMIPNSGIRNAAASQSNAQTAQPTINLSSVDERKDAAPVPTADPSGPHPVITFTEVEHDFGTSMAGNNLKHTFSFVNKGNATLIIDRVKAG